MESFWEEQCKQYPHVTDEIKYNVIKAAEENNSDIVITEIGGTIGDIESDPFIGSNPSIEKRSWKRKYRLYSRNIATIFESRGRIKDKTYAAWREDASRVWNFTLM